MEHSYEFHCAADTSIYDRARVAFTFLYKFVLHAVGLVLAFQTRNIKVNVLNDYRYNTAIIIASTLLIVAVGLLMVDDLTWSGIPLAVILFLIITLYLGLTFLPKVCTDDEEINAKAKLVKKAMSFKRAVIF